MRARLFDLQRFSIGNGPGIRTTVFFQGCPLRCRWCHNPESWGMEAVLQYVDTLCGRCGRCAVVCPRGCHRMEAGRHRLDRTACTACGACAAACPFGALKRLGYDRDLYSLAEDLERDAVYFHQSGGGITLSGGEPALQPEFALALAEQMGRRNIHTALDSCGMCRPEAFRELIPAFGLFLYDLKHMDSERHRVLTGGDNRWILENLDALVRAGCQVLPRFPMIPGCNDDDKNLLALAAYLRELGLTHLDVSVYHDYGREKYGQLGLAAASIAPYEGEREEDRLELLRSRGLQITVI